MAWSLEASTCLPPLTDAAKSWGLLGDRQVLDVDVKRCTNRRSVIATSLLMLR